MLREQREREASRGVVSDAPDKLRGRRRQDVRLRE